MVKIIVEITNASYGLSFRDYAENIELNMFQFFSKMDLYEDEGNLIVPDWFNSFHTSYFSNMKQKVNILDKLSIRFFGTKVYVKIGDEKVIDDLILSTLFVYYEHFLSARIINFIHKGKSINSIKYEKSLSYLAEKYFRTKDEKYRVRSSIHNMDRFFLEK